MISILTFVLGFIFGNLTMGFLALKIIHHPAFSRGIVENLKSRGYEIIKKGD